MMINIDSNIIEYYNNRNEDQRLKSDKRHQIEKIIITEWINKYIKKNFKILETGAGTGAYSIDLANRGYEVHAVELIEKNMDCLKKKINDKMNIIPVIRNAIDLSIYPNNMFDMVLCFGPLYHIKNEIDRNKCIKESIRVCKPNGYIFFEYISNDYTFVKNVKNINNYLTRSSIEFNSNFKILNNVFEYINPNDFEKCMSKNKNIKKLHHIGIDGVSSLIEDRINKLTDIEFNEWLKFLRKVAQDTKKIEYSENILYIVQKIK